MPIIQKAGHSPNIIGASSWQEKERKREREKEREKGNQNKTKKKLIIIKYNNCNGTNFCDFTDIIK